MGKKREERNEHLVYCRRRGIAFALINTMGRRGPTSRRLAVSPINRTKYVHT